MLTDVSEMRTASIIRAMIRDVQRSVIIQNFKILLAMAIVFADPSGRAV
jgi:hypothetical protein